MTVTTPTSSSPQRVTAPRNFETNAWLFMRYSALLLIPLAFGHMILQDVVVGVHNMDLEYVIQDRWGSIGWRVYDAFLLIFAFAHGMNGLRQVLMDYIKKESTFRTVSWILLVAFVVISAAGAIALIATAMP